MKYHTLLVIGTSFFYIGNLIAESHGHLLTAVSLFLISVLFAALGTLKSLQPSLQTIHSTQLGKFISLLAHLITLTFSASIASFVVSEAIGLPSRDFPLTLSFYAIFFYPIALAIVLFPITFIGFFTLIWWNPMTSVLTTTTHRFGVIIGFVVFASISGQALFFWIRNPYFVENLTKFLVFKLDYQHARNYPGIGKDSLIVIHENGIVSIAKYSLDKRLVEITVEKLK